MSLPAFGELNVDATAASHRLLFGVIVVVAVLLLWGHYGTLDILSITQGEVIPSSQIKKIQHLEGGIVRKIFVREGHVVNQDQPLLELESVASSADMGELQSRIAALLVEIRRLEAEAAGSEELKFTPAEQERFGKRVQQAKEQLITRRHNLHNAIAGQSETVVQRRQEIHEIQARLRYAEKKLSMVNEQVNISAKLLTQEITNRYNHLDLLKELNSLQSRIEEDTASLGRSESMLNEANAQLKSVRSKYDEEVGKQLETARRDLNEHQARVGKFEDNVRRTVIRSPVRGVVKTLNVATLGGVIKAGDTVVEIVPENDELVIEAKLAINDIGYVAVDQMAKVRLSSADASRFGTLMGKVINVSPDTLVTKEGNPFYKVRLTTEKSFFSSQGQTYRLVPGMIVQVSILTGSRTILEYIFSPLFNAMHAALGER